MTNKAAKNSVEQWLGSWGASPQASEYPADDINTEGEAPAVSEKTVRNIIRLNRGGDKVRVRLSNDFGNKTLQISSATVGISRGDGANIVAGSLRELTFNNKSTVSIPTGANIYSDAIDLCVNDGCNLAISYYIASQTNKTPSLSVHHNLNHQLSDSEAFSYISAVGDFTQQETDDASAQFGQGKNQHLYFTTAVDVAYPLSRRNGKAGINLAGKQTIVTFGDSITNGDRSTGLDGNYPSILARLVLDIAGQPLIGVVNQGISGNSVLTDSALSGVSALARMDRDVLSQTGVSDMIFMEGINDIIVSQMFPEQMPLDADTLIDGISQVIGKADAHGIKVYVGTLLPYKSAGEETYSEAGNDIRKAVNDWIRTTELLQGYVVDFDLALQSDTDSDVMDPIYQSQDGLHPNSLGYQLMAQTVCAVMFAV